MLLVGFHGGAEQGRVNNVRAYPDGKPPYDLLAPSAQKLIELRKFVFAPNGRQLLYVANALKSESRVLLYNGERLVNGQWQFQGVSVTDKLSHPFDIVFAFEGWMFVSSQDTRRITRYTSPGTEGVDFGPLFTTLRGLAYDRDRQALYAADAGDEKHPGKVLILDRNGRQPPPFSPVEVPQPVHLLYDEAHGWLFIGSEKENAVYAWNPVGEAPPQPVVWNKTGEPNIDATAGLALETTAPSRATLYVASRKTKQILSYPLDFTSGTPRWSPQEAFKRLSGLPDEPEFVGIQGSPYG
jgi:DNA-binding beta-propeller fold protein YncE